jgi:hypothetical protein
MRSSDFFQPPSNETDMKSIIKFFAAALLLFSLPACNDFLDVNVNPNVATRPPLSGLLAVGTYQTALNHFRTGSNTSFYTQYLASPNAGLGSDVYEEVDLSGTWTSIYDAMTDIYDLIQFAEEDNSPELAGAGRLLMAMNLGLLADMWGDVPYADAFTGEDIVPRFDAATSIYQEIFQLLATGRADIEKGPSNTTLSKVGSSDFFFAGDKDKWLKLGHALEARYLNHFSKQSSYDRNAVLTAVARAMEGPADQAQLTRFDVRNPWANVARNNANLILGGWLSEQVIDALNGTTFGVVDPRLERITTPLPDGSFQGTPNGAGRRGDGTIKEECYLDNSREYASDDSPLFVFTFAELKFIEAEAALGIDAERAHAAFLAGIRAHMDDLNVAPDDADAYIAAAYPGLTPASLNRDLVMKEKYVAMFLHPEAWVDARRFDYQYQDFALPANAMLSEFIRRVQYPDVELTRNRQNTPIISSLAQRLFWDQ